MSLMQSFVISDLYATRASLPKRANLTAHFQHFAYTQHFICFFFLIHCIFIMKKLLKLFLLTTNLLLGRIWYFFRNKFAIHSSPTTKSKKQHRSSYTIANKTYCSINKICKYNNVVDMKYFNLERTRYWKWELNFSSCLLIL